MLLEICVQNHDDALRAEKAGADRLELCSRLDVGGLSPERNLIESVLQQVSIPVHVMIRPRPGDFCYTENEFSRMLMEIEQAKELGAQGVVFGMLDSKGMINLEQVQLAYETAMGLNTVFHRAFDLIREPFQALEQLAGCGIDYLLTSGGKETASGAVDLLKELNSLAGDNIKLIAAGGINDVNILTIARQSGIKEFHASAKKINSKDRMVYADVEMIAAMKRNLISQNNLKWKHLKTNT